MNPQLSLQTVHQDPICAEVEQGCDTHLKTEDGTVFHVNSELLSRHSKFFNNLFSIGEETGQSTVIHDIKSDIFEIVLSYLATGRVLLTTENVTHLLVASDFLMIESLVDECRKFVLQNKKVENLVSFFLTAKRIKGLDIEDQCRKLLVVCFEKAVLHSVDEVCCLPYEDLRYFLSHRSLNVSDEHTIWLVIEAWVQKESVRRDPLVPGLLRCLSIDEIDDDLASSLITSPIIRNNVFYEDVGDPCVTLDILSDKKKAQTLILFKNEPPIITGVRLPRFLHFVGKNLQDRGGAELFLSYDDNLDLWRKVGEIPRKNAKLLVSGHLVYILKHVEEGDYELSGRYYDLLGNEEKRMAGPSMRNYVVGEVGGHVYAMEKDGTAIKRYIVESNEWLNMRPRRRLRRHEGLLGALNVNGSLYVLSDTSRGHVFMQVYDPSIDQWRIEPHPTMRRILARPVLYQGKIFLIGGVRNLSNDEDEDFDDHDHGYVDEEFNGGDANEELNGGDANEEFDGGDAGEEFDGGDADEEFNDDDHLGDVFDFMVVLVQNPVNNREENEIDDMDDDEFDPDINLQLEEDDDVERAPSFIDVEVYDPQSNEWMVYPPLPFRFYPVFASVVKDRLYVYQNPRRPVTYWDGSGEWKIERNPSQLFNHKFCTVEDEDVVREIMKRNKREDPTVWLETGLEKEILG